MSPTRAPEPLGGISTAARSPLADPRELSAVSGPLYPVLTLLVRLPQTMVPLGVLTTVALISGSPVLGTLCAGAVTLGSALCGLAMGAASAWRRRRPAHQDDGAEAEHRGDDAPMRREGRVLSEPGQDERQECAPSQDDDPRQILQSGPRDAAQ